MGITKARFKKIEAKYKKLRPHRSRFDLLLPETSPSLIPAYAGYSRIGKHYRTACYGSYSEGEILSSCKKPPESNLSGGFSIKIPITISAT